MGKSVLNDFQKEVLAVFCKTDLAKKFYLAGGTALSEFYFHHRKSEDLDFFTTEEELDIKELERFVNLICTSAVAGFCGFIFYIPREEGVEIKRSSAKGV